MFREEMQVLGLPRRRRCDRRQRGLLRHGLGKRRERRDGGADGKVHRKECACTPHCKCSGNLPDQSDEEAYEMTLE